MRNYEVLYIVDPRIEADDLTSLNDRIAGLITGGGGEVLEVNDWGSRRLSYSIGELREGRYLLIKFRSLPDFIRGLDRQLRLLQRVIRYTISQQRSKDHA
ncbi:MAG: 30S ribosomal protein S6 [bacterium]